MYPKIIEGFPYRYEGFIGVGDRGENTEKTTNISRFSVGKTDKKPTEKIEFRFSVHNTGDTSIARTTLQYVRTYVRVLRGLIKEVHGRI